MQILQQIFRRTEVSWLLPLAKKEKKVYDETIKLLRKFVVVPYIVRVGIKKFRRIRKYNNNFFNGLE